MSLDILKALLALLGSGLPELVEAVVPIVRKELGFAGGSVSELIAALTEVIETVELKARLVAELDTGVNIEAGAPHLLSALGRRASIKPSCGVS